MRTAVVVFPGSNCDRDAAEAVRRVTGRPASMVWHAVTELPEVDLIILPGGFSYGDYLRTGAMAARSPIMQAVQRAAAMGVYILGICNGFQILCEAGLLPGVLLRNARLSFCARTVALDIVNTDTAFTRAYTPNQVLHIPIAHGEGNYYADPATLRGVRDNRQIVFRYGDNPNGSVEAIAGITNPRGNVLGLMPHPERAIETLHGSTDGVGLFESLLQTCARAA